MDDRNEFFRRADQRVDDARRRSARMREHKRAQRFREALAELTALQALLPDDVSVWGHTAEVAVLCGEYAVARDAATRGLAMAPAARFPQWRTVLLISGGIAAYRLSDNADAIRLLEEAVMIADVHPVAHLYLCYALQHAGDTVRARAHAERAVALLAHGTHRDHSTLVIAAIQEIARLSRAPLATALHPSTIAAMSTTDASGLLGMLLTGTRAPPTA